MEFFLSRWVRRLRVLREHRRVEREMGEEMRLHVAMEADELMRERGLSSEEAHRQAMIAFGGVERHIADARVSRGLGVLDRMRFSWLDVKLGLRMLAKYPGLSLVSVIGMSVAIAIGAGGFAAIDALMDPSVPLDDGERVVSLQNNIEGRDNPQRHALHDFAVWRTELKSIADLAAFAIDGRNVVTPSGIEVIEVAEMTASGFRVARVSPLLGRTLLDDDERAGAPPVVVLGYDEWQRRFHADPNVIGSTVRMGTTVHTVVGVMPEGFRFPVNQRYWVPLRLNALNFPRGGGPEIYVFGRLADAVTIEGAQAELATLGRRMSAEYPDTHELLRPVVLPYTYAFTGVHSPTMGWVLRGFQLALGLLLVVVAVNVAVLVYARTAARTSEIVVRSALGAARTRIVAQLFAEALVLSAIAAAIGLGIAAFALAKTQAFLEAASNNWVPFWMQLHLSPSALLYTTGLVLVAGVIVGVIPALQVTGRGLQASLQQISTRGSQMQLGPVWTALIVAQVALAVAALPFAGYIAGNSLKRSMQQPNYAANEIVQGWVSLEGDEALQEADSATRHAIETRVVSGTRELLRRIETEPLVSAVAYTSAFPGAEGGARIEVDSSGARHYVRTTLSDTDMFAVLGVPLLAGRAFTPADTLPNANTVIVDRVFAEQILGGGNVLGRRIRTVERNATGGADNAGPWLEIVGVVREFGRQPDFDPANAKIYLPTALRYAFSTGLTIRLDNAAAAASFGQRLRELAAVVDPGLRMHQVSTAADAERESQQSLLAIAIAVAAITGSVLLLSAAGIYAMMSFTVVRRRREIGIRTALGAQPRRILSGIFARASAQLGAGVAGGLLLAIVIDRAMGVGPLSGRGVLLIPGVVALVLIIGLLAALGPARRGLAVSPMETLREE